MTFSPEWDQRYRDHTNMAIWPWSDVVSLVMTHARPAPGGAGYRVLEVGCGAGANIDFFRSLGVEYCAVEGSAAIVAMLRQRYPDLAERLWVGDFTADLHFPGPFDLVLDRSSLTHNHTAAIRRTLTAIHGVLKPGGVFIGVQWFATDSLEYPQGQAAEDPYTRTGYRQGRFAGVGRAHFSDRDHLLDLLGGFRLEFLQKTTVENQIPEGGALRAYWNFVARK
ncbi:MAG: class I SAM-dependent methyltransferase [Magnetococcales bacterium]|nr:class I SAM-dependent methyltransferase [Magnetococcales bacterium]